MGVGRIVTARKKGQFSENRGLKILKEQGWFLEARAPPTTKWLKGVDLCGGLFDAILHKQHGGLKRRLYVQFKTNNKPDLSPFEEFCKNRCDDRDYVVVWVYKKRKGFRVYQFHYDFDKVKLEVFEALQDTSYV